MKHFKLYENFSDPFFNYVEQIASITSGKQKEFYEWQKKHAELVKMEVPESVLPNCTPAWMKKHIKIKGCYENATKVMNLDPEVKYVEGVFMMGGSIPINHAWNSYKGKHFDVTSTMWKKTEDSYYMLVELDSKQVWKILEDTKMYGELLYYMLRKGMLR